MPVAELEDDSNLVFISHALVSRRDDDGRADSGELQSVRQPFNDNFTRCFTSYLHELCFAARNVDGGGEVAAGHNAAGEGRAQVLQKNTGGEAGHTCPSRTAGPPPTRSSKSAHVQTVTKFHCGKLAHLQWARST